MRCIRGRAFRNSLFAGCSNGGISEKFEEVLIPCSDGYEEVDENNPPENLCRVVRHDLFGDSYIHLEPFKAPEHIGWMDGGAIVDCCDSRFSRISQYPIRLHDRQETNNLYDMLSR